MPARETRLISAEPLARGTGAFHFEKPADFRFRPGQTVDLALPDAGKHTFSLVSAPFEDRLTVATRLRGSAYKRTLAGLEPGAAATVEGPYGSLTLHADASRPAIFVAGGIGITPFVGMLRLAARDGSSRAFLLLYSNRRPEDAAFLEELRGLERQLPAFRLVPTMTGLAPGGPGWNGRIGRFGPAQLREASDSHGKAVWYVTGAPALVEGTREMLSRLGVPDDDVRSEEFFGY